MYSLLQQCMGGKASSLDCCNCLVGTLRERTLHSRRVLWTRSSSSSCNCSGASELMLCATFTSGLFSTFVYLWCLSCAWLCLCVTKGTLYCGVTCHCSVTDAMTWEHECMNGHWGYCKWHSILIIIFWSGIQFWQGRCVVHNILEQCWGAFLESR
jgi:hypothetical protein